MPDALLCKECWSLVTEDYGKQTQTNRVRAGPKTCDLCRLLEKAIAACGVKPIFTLPDVGTTKKGFDVGDQDLEEKEEDRRKVDVTVTQVLGKGSKKLAVGQIELEITTPTDQNLPWSGFANATDISTYGGSEECVAKLRSWMETCVQDHQKCAEISTVHTEGPKRLIDTGPLDCGPVLVLIDYPKAGGEQVKYGALSYCWGKGEENYLTTGDTYQARRDGIVFEELPRMFRDAVLIARRVGCRYLWIDPICIIQQDRLDWASEAPRMHLIYGNAYIVIAATLCSSPSSGIFTNCPPAAHFDFDCAGETYKVGVKERVDHSVRLLRDWEDFQANPLHSRAWAFQERLMARRMIHYSPSELVWDCRTTLRCECSGIEWPVRSAYSPGSSLMSEVANALAVVDEGDDLRDAWHGIMNQYNSGHLTVYIDRLAALSGLARRFAFPHMGKYLAGIWSSYLPDALDWNIYGAVRPDHYRAPSWSWASLDGPVTSTNCGAEEIELIEADCTPIGDDSYGEVSDGYVVVRGEFAPASPGWHNHNHDYDIPIDEDRDENGEIWALKLSRSGGGLSNAIVPENIKKGARSLGKGSAGDRDGKCFKNKPRSVVKIV